VKIAKSALTRKEASWLTFFGITSGIYRVIVFGGILLFVADRLLIIESSWPRFAPWFG
jgi:hypothetical protein